jgi:ATPase family protein associated with various cellular activities (AAA)
MTTVDPKERTETALDALLSFWRPSDNSAWRDSEAQKATDGTTKFYPTATFQAVRALGSCGLWVPSAKLDKRNNILSASMLVVPDGSRLPTPENIFDRIIGTAPATTPDKVREIFEMHTSHKDEPDGLRSSAVVIAHLLAALRTVTVADPKLFVDREACLRSALQALEQRLIKVASKPGGGLLSVAELEQQPYLYLVLIFYVAEALCEWELLAKRIGMTGAPELEQLRTILGAYFERQAERLMSRRNIPREGFDASALTFVTRGLRMLTLEVQYTQFFKGCIKAALAGQGADGSWPPSVSFEYSPRGSVFQPPSAEIALNLLESVFRPAMLVDCRPHDSELLALTLPAMRKTAEHLERPSVSRTHYPWGWCSDRSRRPGLAETWVTGTVARFFHTLWLAEIAARRADVLERYPVDHSTASTAAPSALMESWRENVVEPNAGAASCKRLQTDFISPIHDATATGELFRRPKQGVSFVLYGPPGSGKTHLMKEVSKALGWPLLSLNPGHFIRRGLDLIETTSSEIFTDLQALHHVVVFFDECDELFRERTQQEGTRNILTFVTACMLPKLQQLHDDRRVVFAIGTNFLHRIDTAIRRDGRFDALLLIDRPDAKARERLLQRGWEKVSGESAPVWSLAVRATHGWMAKNVIAYGEVSARESSPSVRENIGDYVEWCRDFSAAEFTAASIDQAKAASIRQNWKGMLGFTKVKKRTAGKGARGKRSKL